MSTAQPQNIRRQRLNRRLFIQMSGAPGSGKSTTASVLAPVIDAVIVPHDDIKSALLDHLEDRVSFSDVSKVSYATTWALAENMMLQGLSVIIDTPCLYPEILDNGRALAVKHGFTYHYVEIHANADDPAVLATFDARLRSRTAMRAQCPAVNEGPVDAQGDFTSTKRTEMFKKMIANACRPSEDDKNAIYLEFGGHIHQHITYILERLPAGV